MWNGYGQFCPIAQAAEVLCERWTPLVLRDVMYGSRRFNQLARGVPLMSRGLLAQRLKELQRAGVLERRGMEYHLTAAGEALRPIIEQMGLWALHRGARELAEAHLDDALLVWSLRRAFLEVLLGRRSLRAALREGTVKIAGSAQAARRVPEWLPLNGELLRGMGIAPGTPVPGGAGKRGPSLV